MVLTNLLEKTKKHWEIISTVFWLIGLVAIIFSFFAFQKVTIHGSSMENNFFQKESLIVNRSTKDLKRGQVVTFYSSLEKLNKISGFSKAIPFFDTSNNKILLKRVIALPGESIKVAGSTVIIYNKNYPDGKVLIENYLDPKIAKEADKQSNNPNYFSPKITLTGNQYFIMGDNRPVSSDSRSNKYGAFEKESLFGTVMMRYWPISKIKNVTIGEYSFRDINQDDRNKFKNLIK